ncbi:MAG: hypothetical protein UR39_C0001G0015 [Candidatus Woesebacteria bacterium GW2011_GWA1_33_30]|uniref:Uncharacterized protein n=1 Tax=Candidatus Woesebacteria bacterium GW2011_GWA2_33_28 TaxID=1618561 RepID=A0A0G0CAL4_9BACT|nr:MAG: hypothetical protein UR38_C0001G0016 [Candidatus Woesebacteria bacterium GW2011_GWA2_33_28]KKP48982.1 MAG: hypothetical protein UR39_C0001G0015 [Candidatus Woesebacteria bacterium GW2011_GWA1_33_30]KKP49910.1 MAG: hypothetical protein UR40_C0003G0082 [Microgenomates group bacterium GW2011_GWC1_33_32]KKP52574.1 MAG: hypothetical protein UR44_C0001G0016 [Candidatus Woesebacteria bacterium GW2011_GWB1_33_38]KKP55993.1 MAG: hypothetical protein UR48_C0043G0004 [Microgenomates group bacteriu
MTTQAPIQTNEDKLHELEKKALGGAEVVEPLEDDNVKEGRFDTPGIYRNESPRPFGKEN